MTLNGANDSLITGCKYHVNIFQKEVGSTGIAPAKKKTVMTILNAGLAHALGHYTMSLGLCFKKALNYFLYLFPSSMFINGSNKSYNFIDY